MNANTPDPFHNFNRWWLEVGQFFTDQPDTFRPLVERIIKELKDLVEDERVEADREIDKLKSDICDLENDKDKLESKLEAIDDILHP